VELIGEYEGSGYKDPPSIVRRGDGQVIQLTNLLYLVAKQADGRRGYADIAEGVSDELGRRLTDDNVRFLIEEKLYPLGVLTGPSGEQPKVAKADPLLALRFRTAVIPERAANLVARMFSPLFLPPVVIAAVVGFAALDAWLFLHHGVAQGMRETLYQPQYILLMFGFIVLSAAFHEIGHAAGCAYGGAKPGKMGCGLYLAWPAFYTDVTDAYRLGRAARLRTDLGGVYFNALFCLAAFGGYALTGFEPLLLVIVVQHFEIAHQLLPVVRLDGYYIVADLTGVPDLFNRIKPILVSMLPWKKADERVTVLKRWVRMAVTVWVLAVVPLLLFQLFMLLIHLPRILGTAFDSLGKQVSAVGDAFGTGNAWGGLSGIVQIMALSLPVAGILLMLWRIGSRLATGVWRRTEGKPVQRVLAVAAGGALAVALGSAWLPADNYKPIQPGERGTVLDGVASVRALPTGRGPLAPTGEARTVEEPLTPEPAGAETGTSTTTTTPETTSTTAERTTQTTVRATSSTTSSSSTTTTTTTTTTP
jgi:putative peptide zinc metalloprotease protein